MKEIKDITPQARYEIEHYGGMSIQGDLVSVQTFTIKETIKLMKLYADACIGKKLVDMGYKDYVTGDPERDLAEIIMLPWFRENEE